MKKLLILVLLLACTSATTAFAQYAKLEGKGSYSCKGKRANLTCSVNVDAITNRSSEDTLPLQLMLVVSDKPYSGGTLKGSWLVRKNLGSLSAGYYFENVKASNTGRLKVTGIKYPVVVLMDSTGTIHSFSSGPKTDFSVFRSATRNLKLNDDLGGKTVSLRSAW